MKNQNQSVAGIRLATRSALLACIGLAGCWSMGKPMPTASAGFQPTDVLPNPPEQVFSAATAEMDDEGVAITSQSKEDGRITTDYVAGPSMVSAVGGTNSRFKYLITVRPSGSGTKLIVHATLESAGTNAAQAWHDVSESNPDAVTGIQHALIEKIEKRLRA